MAESPNLSALDIPSLLALLFHPRKDHSPGPPPGAEDWDFPVNGEDIVGGRYHPAAPGDPTILFFHGNGEIAADYDDLALLYRKMNLGLLAVDFRGYGRSTGRPTVSAMIADAHAVYEQARARLHSAGAGPLIVMGRSLGSAPALELAAAYPEIGGLILESGFARSLALLGRLGFDPARAGVTEDPFRHLAKIKAYTGPTLIIHAERDTIIPFSDGKKLFAAAGSPDKAFLPIPGAGHNDIFQYGFNDYLNAVTKLAERVRRKAGENR